MGSDRYGHHALGLRHHQLCHQHTAFYIKGKGRQRLVREASPFLLYDEDHLTRTRPPSARLRGEGCLRAHRS